MAYPVCSLLSYCTVHMKKKRFLEFCGKYSFELYLWHAFILGLVTRVFDLVDEWQLGLWVANVVAIIISLLWAPIYAKGIGKVGNLLEKK